MRRVILLLTVLTAMATAKPHSVNNLVGSTMTEVYKHYLQAQCLNTKTSLGGVYWRLDPDTTVVVHHGTVIAQIVETPKHAIHGLKVGDSQETVEKKLGECLENSVSFHSKSKMSLNYPNKGLRFWLKGGRVSRIVLFDKDFDSDDF